MLILVLAFALRFHQLGDKGLWGDEIAQARWALLPLAKMWERFRDPPDFILHFLLGQFAQQFGASAFWVRLPSAVTSLLAVPATYLAARRLAGKNVALVAMFLLAVSPFQIWYAQDARMYAALACYAAFSLYFFLRVLDRPQWRAVLGLTLANTLALYTHLFGAMPLLIQGVALVGIAGAAVLRARDRRRRVLLSQNFLFLIASFGLTALLALPLAPGTLPYVLNPTLKGIEAEFSYAPFHLTPAFLQLLASDIGLAPDLGWRTVLSCAFALVGLFALLRTRPRSAWIAAVWLLLPLLMLQVAHPGRGVANRYLIFLQPVYLVAIAAGMIWLMEKMVLFKAAGKAMRAPWAAILVAGMGVLFFVSAPPLAALYPRAKLNDWQTLAKFFETNAQAGDILMTEKEYWAVNALAYYVPNANAFSSPPATIAEMQNARAHNRRLWYVSFGGALHPAEQAWVQNNLTRVDDTAWMRPDLVYRPRDEFHFTQSEGLVTLYKRDGVIPFEILYTNELGDRANVTPFFPLVSGKALEAKLNAIGQGVLEIEYSGKQPAQFEVYVNDVLLAPVRDDKRTPDGATARFDLPGDAPEVRIKIKNVLAASPLQVRAVRLVPE